MQGLRPVFAKELNPSSLAHLPLLQLGAGRSISDSQFGGLGSVCFGGGTFSWVFVSFHFAVSYDLGLILFEKKFHVIGLKKAGAGGASKQCRIFCIF